MLNENTRNALLWFGLGYGYQVSNSLHWKSFNIYMASFGKVFLWFPSYSQPRNLQTLYDYEMQKIKEKNTSNSLVWSFIEPQQK